MSHSARAIAFLALLAARPVVAAAPAFDCRLAHSPVERLICSDDGLAALDREQSARYQTLRRAVSSQGAARLLDNQRAWLKSRDDCTKQPDPPSRIECLTRVYQGGITDLDARFRQAGGLVLEQRASERRLARLRVTETEDHPWLTGQPAGRADAFNRYVSKRLELAKGLFAAAPIQLDAKPEGETQYSRYYEIHHMDGKLISIEFFTYHESYFGHAWRSEFALNWDLGRNRPLNVETLFRTDADWRAAVTEHARSWLNTEGDSGDPEAVLSLLELDDNEGWLFNDDGAVLLPGRGERSLAGASAEIPVPYDVLAPYLSPDAPLPVTKAP
jgi:uncharacterized protein